MWDDKSNSELTEIINTHLINRWVQGKRAVGNDLVVDFVFFSNFATDNLQNVNFSNANLSNTLFDSADFTNANLTGANLNDAVLDDAILSKANLKCKNHIICNG